MGFAGFISFILIIVNVLFSYKGLTNNTFYEGYSFNVDRVLLAKDYKRLITSGFLHVSWSHLIFNMLTLLFFGQSLELYLGSLAFLLIYFAGLIGGNLLSLFIHRNHGEFSSVGASGAICAIIFSSIALFPGFSIGFFLLPIAIPGWLYGLIYVLYSIYGIRSGKENVGHEAHLGGGLVGMLVALLLHPDVLVHNYLAIGAILLPSIIFMYIIINQPTVLLVDNHFFKKNQHYYSIDHAYNAKKVDEQKEIDAILEKIHRKGMSSLTKKEKELLDHYSKTVR